MHTKPATMPSTMAPIGPAKPDAGVTATRPATAPEAPPSRLGLPLATFSASIQASAAAAVATKVLIMASAAVPLASSAEPALKPNQPTHSSAAPTSVMVSECGGIASLPKPTRLPTSRQPTKPAMPELMCTTVPPAKSSAPHWKAKPALAATASRLPARRPWRQPCRGGQRLGSRDGGARAGPVPDHVRDREVDERGPQRDEQHDGGELHALGHRARRSAPA